MRLPGLDHHAHPAPRRTGHAPTWRPRRLRYAVGAVTAALSIAVAATTVVVTNSEATPGLGARNAGWHRANERLAWLSGASGDQASDGSFEAWRNGTLQIAGTWNDTNDAMVNMYTICGAQEPFTYARWKKPLDIAVGAFEASKGENWADAAAGKYEARWRQHLEKTKQCWGDRDAGMLYLRFAHEFNGPWTPWAATPADKDNFIKAFQLYSKLRYEILPDAKVVYSPNASNKGDAEYYAMAKDFWPGDHTDGKPVANVFSITMSNEWEHVPDNRLNHLQYFETIASTVGAPFAVSGWGNNGDPAGLGGGGEAEDFMKYFYRRATAKQGSPRSPQPGQLLYEIYNNAYDRFQLTPDTLQPKTAQAYRALFWGHNDGSKSSYPLKPVDITHTHNLSSGSCSGQLSFRETSSAESDHLFRVKAGFTPAADAQCDLSGSTLRIHASTDTGVTLIGGSVTSLAGCDRGKHCTAYSYGKTRPVTVRISLCAPGRTGKDCLSKIYDARS